MVILAAAIALSPSFSAGEIAGGRVVEIRAEDILIVILGLVWLANFLISGRKKIEKPPLLLPILAWLGIGFFSVLTNWIFGNLDISRGFFYFLKEIEFFVIYFYVFYHIRSLDSAKFIIKIWILLGLVNVGWIIYQAFKGIHFYGEYGPGRFGEPGAAFPSGGFFLILFIFLFNILLYYYFKLNISNLKKGILIIGIVGLSTGVFSSGSRISFLGLIFALILSFLFYSFKKGFLKPFIISVLILVFMGIIFIFVSSKVPDIKRSLNLEYILAELTTTNPDSRLSIWKNQLSEFSNYPFAIFFGLGKSVLLTTDESHSQHVRNLIESGIIGSLIFLFLIFVIIKKSWQGFLSGESPFLIGLSGGLLVSTFAMLFISITAEAFVVVRIAEIYWFFAAITMAVLSFGNKQQAANN